MRRNGRLSWLTGILAVFLLLPTQGCVTYAMWGMSFPAGESFEEDEEEPARREPHYARELEQTVATSAAVVLHGDANLPEAGLWVVEADGAVRWWLRPGLAAASAAQWFTDPEFGRVTGARFRVQREVVDGEVASADVAMTLSVAVDPAAVGGPVDPATLRPATRDMLATPRWNAYVFAADPTLHLPAVLRQCVQRATAVDLARLCEGSPATVRAESFVFVGADGEPCYEPGMPLPPGSDDPELPLLERLQILRATALLLRVSVPGGEQVLWLRPERLWQWSALEAVSSSHVSHWVLEPVAATRYAKPSPPTVVLPAQGEFVESTYRLVPLPVLNDGPSGFWEKLAVTPFTLQLDCTLFAPINALALWLDDAAEREARHQRRKQGSTGYP